MPEIYTNNFWGEKVTVTAGNTSAPIPTHGVRTISLGVTPGEGGSALVEISLSSPEEVAANTARWFPWPKGTVTTASVDAAIGPISAVRCTATTASCTFELLGV